MLIKYKIFIITINNNPKTIQLNKLILLKLLTNIIFQEMIALKTHKSKYLNLYQMRKSKLLQEAWVVAVAIVIKYNNQNI